MAVVMTMTPDEAKLIARIPEEVKKTTGVLEVGIGYAVGKLSKAEAKSQLEAQTTSSDAHKKAPEGPAPK